MAWADTINGIYEVINNQPPKPMTQFTSPQEAIAACESEFETAWLEFVKAINLDLKTQPVAKTIFRAGFMAGAGFVSGVLVEKLMAHGKNHIIDPSVTA